MKCRIFIQTLFFTTVTIMLSACLTGKLSAPDMPPTIKPSPVNMTEINGLKLGLPKGWKSTQVAKGNIKSGGIIQLEHKNYGFIVIFKAPTMADARYGQLFTHTLAEEVMPDYEAFGGANALESGAIIQIYKGSILIDGNRWKHNFYAGYNISQGMTEYFMYGLHMDKPSKEKAFYDFIAIANSI